MKSQEFCYWLQGMFELSYATSLDTHQTAIIKKHLAMVFLHDIDPSYPQEQQAVLNALHNSDEAPTLTTAQKALMRC